MYVSVMISGCVPVTFSGAPTVSGGDFALSSYPAICGSNSYPTLAPNVTCYIYLVFAPLATGTRTGTLTITSDATTSPQTVSLSGKGVTNTATAVMTPANLNVGTQVVGTTASNVAYAYLYNTGNVPLTITAVNITGDYSIGSVACPLNTVVQPNGNCYVYVNFTP